MVSEITSMGTMRGAMDVDFDVLMAAALIKVVVVSDSDGDDEISRYGSLVVT